MWEGLDVYGIHRGIRADSAESRTMLIARYTMDSPRPPVILSSSLDCTEGVEIEIALNNFATAGVYPPSSKQRRSRFSLPLSVGHLLAIHQSDELKVDRADWKNRGKREKIGLNGNGEE